MVRSYMVRRRILSQHVGASRHQSVQFTGHPNACAAQRTSAPKVIYHPCAIFITVALAMQYVSLQRSPEKQFSVVEIGWTKVTSSHEKRLY